MTLVGLCGVRLGGGSRKAAVGASALAVTNLLQGGGSNPYDLVVEEAARWEVTMAYHPHGADTMGVAAHR